jgi:probable rRNA maturation factor
MTFQAEPAPDTDLDLSIQVEEESWRGALPDLEPLARRWVTAAAGGAHADRGGAAALLDARNGYEMGLVFTSDATVRALNRDWRGADRPTNVLAFDNADPPPTGAPWQLGDVVLAFATTRNEARAAGVPVADHAAHLVIHGVLHLFGYDHQAEAEARRMERLEAEILGALGIADPYVAAGDGA